jgi:hypothetical protein
MKPMNSLPSELEGEVTIRVVDDMPVASPGFVIYDETGHCNVYLNGRYNHESNMQTADHELRHILNDDFFNDDDIRTVESRADAHATPRHRLPPLFKARDLLQQTPPVAAESTPPRSQTNSTASQLSPRQAAVLLRAISDLDDWLFRDTTYDL